MLKIPEAYMDLLERPVVAVLATINPDGTPQASPVWVDYAEGYVRVNSARGRQKDKNMRTRPWVSLVLVDPTNPYRYMEIRGRVVKITEEGAREHIDALAGKYTGQARFTPQNPDEVRVMYYIEPTRVIAH